MKESPLGGPAGAWPLAILLLERWLESGERADSLLETVTAEGASGKLRPAGWPAESAPGRPFGDAPVRARCQHLFFGAVRNRSRLEAAIDAVVPRKPRARLRAVLLVGGFELLEAEAGSDDEGRAARIVHHAVNQAKTLLSPAEARLVNAVLRRLPAAGLRAGRPEAAADVGELARYHSHPDWLVQRWRDQFGDGALRSLLRWNQTPPPVYGRWRGPGDAPDWLAAAGWPGFHVVPAGRWADVEPLLAAGALYLQDPSTQVAAQLLAPRAGETVLDLCAAPGGKSLLLADLLEQAAAGSGGEPAAGRIVAVDLPDARRIDRLKANLAKARRADVALVQADVLKLSSALLREHGLPDAFPAVLLDVPCSNTGVIRHRVDVKWRLRPGDFAKDAARQVALLKAASHRVAPGGRLVYSTCSLEAEENEGVVTTFLRGAGERFELAASRHSRPWETGCDGAGAFLLRRKA